MPEKYHHVFSICFSVTTDKPCLIGDDYPSKEEIFEALEQRIENLKFSDVEYLEAIGAPDQTFIIPEGEYADA